LKLGFHRINPPTTWRPETGRWHKNIVLP